MICAPRLVSDRRAPRAWLRTALPSLLVCLALVPSLALAQGDASPGTPAGEGAAAQDEERRIEAVARLTVIPEGDQTFDLATGETTLPEGGTIIDRQTGLTLQADRIAYVEGEYIHAEAARARTDAGLLTAPTLRIDVPTLTAQAPEGVSFERPGLAVRARSAEYRFEESLVRFDAPEGTDTTLQAETLYLAVDTGDVLLIGPYLYQDGPFTLRDERPDSALQLRPVTAEDGTVGYRAANEVDPDLWARVAPLP